MAKFISINDGILINKNEVLKVERLLYDIGKDNFEGTCCETGERELLEYLTFDLAKITLSNGEDVLVKILIYGPEEDEVCIEEWFHQAISYIEAEWEDLAGKFGIKVKTFN